jgi:hypothetical protein
MARARLPRSVRPFQRASLDLRIERGMPLRMQRTRPLLSEKRTEQKVARAGADRRRAVESMTARLRLAGAWSSR